MCSKLSDDVVLEPGAISPAVGTDRPVLVTGPELWSLSRASIPAMWTAAFVKAPGWLRKNTD